MTQEQMGLLFWSVLSALSRWQLVDRPDHRLVLAQVQSAFSVGTGELAHTSLTLMQCPQYVCR